MGGAAPGAPAGPRDAVARAALALGVAALALWVAAGFVEAWRTRGALPALTADPLVLARDAFAGRDPVRWIAEARSLTQIQPRNQGAWLALAHALADAGREPAAVRAYESALALGPMPPTAHAQLARLYGKRGDLEAARAQARLAQEGGVTLSDAFLRALGMPPAGGAGER